MAGFQAWLAILNTKFGSKLSLGRELKKCFKKGLIPGTPMATRTFREYLASFIDEANNFGAYIYKKNSGDLHDTNSVYQHLVRLDSTLTSWQERFDALAPEEQNGVEGAEIRAEMQPLVTSKLTSVVRIQRIQICLRFFQCTYFFCCTSLFLIQFNLLIFVYTYSWSLSVVFANH